MMKHYFLLGLLLGWATAAWAQQVPHRTAFATADFVWNPAMTASSEFLDWGATYRQQWLGFEAAPSTANAHFQFPFVEQNMSVGAWATRDVAGPLSYHQVGGSYAYGLDMGRSGRLSIGLSAMASQFQLDGGGLLVADQADPVLLTQKNTTLLPNVGLGLFYVSNPDLYTLNDNGFFVGVGSQQLLRRELVFEEEQQRVALDRSVHANAIVGARFVNGFSFVEPSVWVDYAQSGLLYVRGNVLVEQSDAFWVGGSVASDYALSVQGGMILSDWLGAGSLRIGGMGTYSVGRLGRYQGMGFELVMAYRYWR